jgi:hypothetical protein
MASSKSLTVSVESNNVKIFKFGTSVCVNE